MPNPFKFGSVVADDFFTDRVKEASEAKRVLESGNHLILISPRRYGKTSLIQKVAKATKRPVVYLDLQLLTDVTDMASQLMKRILLISKWENIKHSVQSFRIVPKVELNPLTNGVDIAFQPMTESGFTPLEDVLGLIEKLGEKGKRPIVVFDEFQEISVIGKMLPKQLRSVIQHHKNVNYVFLGSSESMMKEIFESKKSPFYHFGHLMLLGKIPYKDFDKYLRERFDRITDQSEAVSEKILAFTDCHPYYTQQLAYYCYSFLEESFYCDDMIEAVTDGILEVHNNDFERLWMPLRTTEKRILIALAGHQALSAVAQPTSTVYSCVRRLAEQGFVIKNGDYKLDDPFFGKWITAKRNSA